MPGLQGYNSMESLQVRCTYFRSGSHTITVVQDGDSKVWERIRRGLDYY